TGQRLAVGTAHELVFSGGRWQPYRAEFLAVRDVPATDVDRIGLVDGHERLAVRREGQNFVSVSRQGVKDLAVTVVEPHLAVRILSGGPGDGEVFAVRAKGDPHSLAAETLLLIRPAVEVIIRPAVEVSGGPVVADNYEPEKVRAECEVRYPSRSRVQGRLQFAGRGVAQFDDGWCLGPRSGQGDGLAVRTEGEEAHVR